MSQRRSRACFAAAVLAAAVAPRAHAVLFYNDSQTSTNTTAPTGTLANSGWQWEGNWAGFYNGTPISLHYFISAVHIGGSVGNPFIFNGTTYNTTAMFDIPNTDLRVWQVDGTFPTYAPLWNDAAGKDGSEIGKRLVMIGRGTDRGADVLVSGQTRGWQWGADNHTQRWGENIVTSYAPYAVNGDNKLLSYDFDAPGNTNTYSGVNEASATGGDSGGGVFIKSGNQYKLAGISAFVTGPYGHTDTDPVFNAALFDATSLWYRPQSPPPSPPPPPVYIDPVFYPPPNPSASEPSRIAANLSVIRQYLSPTWDTDADGTWSTANNWSGPTNPVPSGQGADANFRGVIGAPRTITLDSSRTVGNIYFDNSFRYTLAGSGTSLTLSNTGSNDAGITVYSGSHTISIPTTILSNTNINVIPAASTLTMGTISGGAALSLVKQGSGTLEVSNVRVSDLNVSAGTLKVLPDETANGTSRLTTLTIAAGARLDLTNNRMVVDYTGATPVNTIRQYLINGRGPAGFGNATWNGTSGIVSSTARASGDGVNLAIGYAENSAIPTGSYTSFSGQTVDSSSILIKYTRGADADLDGVVGNSDVTIVGGRFGSAGSGQWYLGDFDYSGMCDNADVTALGGLFNVAAAPLSAESLSAQFGASFAAAFESGQTSGSTVPEPGLLSLIGLAPLLLARRRRR